MYEVMGLRHAQINLNGSYKKLQSFVLCYRKSKDTHMHLEMPGGHLNLGVPFNQIQSVFPSNQSSHPCKLAQYTQQEQCWAMAGFHVRQGYLNDRCAKAACTKAHWRFWENNAGGPKISKSSAQ